MSQFVRFLLVGVLNTLFGFAIIFGCMYVLRLGPVASNVIGYCCGLLTSYALNRSFTFRSTARGIAEPARFLAVFGASYVTNLLVLIALIDLAGLGKGIAQIIAGGAYVVTSFLLNRYYVFRQSRAPNALK